MKDVVGDNVGSDACLIRHLRHRPHYNSQVNSSARITPCGTSYVCEVYKLIIISFSFFLVFVTRIFSYEYTFFSLIFSWGGGGGGGGGEKKEEHRARLDDTGLNALKDKYKVRGDF